MSVDQNAKPIRVIIYLGRYFGDYILDLASRL
jgi:hypothetical protein